MRALKILFSLVLCFFVFKSEVFSSPKISITIGPTHPPSRENRESRDRYISILKKYSDELIQDNVRILAIGINSGPEISALLSLKESEGINNMSITGVEIDEAKLIKARSFFGDVENVELLNKLPSSGEFDLIIFRHPNSVDVAPGVSDGWRDTFLSALKLLKVGGKVVITSYFKCESEFFLEIAKENISGESGFNLKIKDGKVNENYAPTKLHYFYLQNNYKWISVESEENFLEDHLFEHSEDGTTLYVREDAYKDENIFKPWGPDAFSLVITKDGNE